jgi:hypothetical protein
MRVVFVLLLLTAAVWLLVAFSDNTHPFQSCTEASEAGASLPLHVGDPGWNATLDTDHNGSAC